MSPVFAKNGSGSGSWKNISQILIKKSGAGSWKSIVSGFIKLGTGLGSWKQFWPGSLSIQQQVQISQSTNSTTFLTTLTGTNYHWFPGTPSLTYYFERSTDGGSNWPTTLTTGSIQNPSYGLSNTKTYSLSPSGPNAGVSPNVLNYYRFRVHATSGGISASSTSLSTTIQGPTDITISLVNPTYGSIEIGWTASTGANRYLVYKSTDNSIFSEYTSVPSPTTSIWGISDLTGGNTYYFYVVPVTGGSFTYRGYSGNNSNTLTLPILATPSLSTATSLSGGFSFNIENYNSSNTYNLSTTAGDFTINGATVTVTGLSTGQSATVTVGATRSGYGNSNTAQRTGSAVANLITNPAYGSSTSTGGGWTASISTQPNPTGGTYSVISQTAGSASVNSSTGALTASGLSVGQSSTVTVRYSKSGYNSVDITASGSALSKLATPQNVSASDDRTDGINVTWGSVSGAAYYGVWYGPTPSYNSTPDFQNITSTSYLDDSVGAGVSRDYYVQAFRSGNPTDTKSDWGGPDSGTRLSLQAPVNTAAPEVSPSSGTAGSTQYSCTTGSWTGTAPISYSYQWQYRESAQNWPPAPGTNNNSTYTPPSDYTSLYGNSLRCTVTASNSVNSASANSNVVTVSSGGGGSAPATPTNVALTGSGVVSWTASSGATSYEIEFFTAQNSIGLNAAGPYTVTGISNSPYQLVSPYASPNNWARVRVRARNSTDASLYSNWVPSETTYT